MTTTSSIINDEERNSSDISSIHSVKPILIRSPEELEKPEIVSLWTTSSDEPSSRPQDEPLQTQQKVSLDASLSVSDHSFVKLDSNGSQTQCSHSLDSQESEHAFETPQRQRHVSSIGKNGNVLHSSVCTLMNEPPGVLSTIPSLFDIVVLIASCSFLFINSRK
jgi:hypothetical protein